MPNLIETLAQDLNRALLHGARQKSAAGKTLPATVLSGQQAAADVTALARGVEIFLAGVAKPAATFRPDAANVQTTNAAVTTALTNPGPYFELKPEKQIPTWIYHQKAFSLPEKPLPEDIVRWSSGERDAAVLRLPPTVLREAEIGAPAPATLCRVVSKTVGNATYEVAEPWPLADWTPSILLQCKMEPAWTRPGESQDGTPIPPLESDPPVSVFELSGIPQSQRWYLDQLGLLDDLGATLEEGSTVKLWLQPPAGADGVLPTAIKIEKWVLTRRNLTGLARPGDAIADVGDVTPADLEFPYAATEEASTDTLRLLQMASITNSGGYFLRLHEPALNAEMLPYQKHGLSITVELPQKPADGEATARPLPKAANAVGYTKASAESEPKVIRFEGRQHVVAEPYAPPGCLAFGWRRPLPTVTAATNFPEFPEGFARTVHLLDYEVEDGTGTLIEQWQEVVQWNTAGTRQTAWRNEPCSGDTGPALSPVKRLPGQTDEDAPIVILALDREEPQPDPPDGTLRGEYAYRMTIRFDKEGDVYRRLGSAEQRRFSIAAGYRDAFGNRLLRQQGSHERTLYYTDTMTSPAEWPGFLFHLYPSAAQGVALEAQYTKPREVAPADLQRKLQAVRAQLQGVNGDVTVTLVNDAADDGQVHFTYAATAGGDLHAALLEMLEAALAGHASAANPPIVYRVTMMAGDAPRMFAPVVELKRTKAEYLPPDGDYPADADLRQAVEGQVTKARSAISLAAGAFASPAGAISEFRQVAMAFQEKLSAGLSSQAAIRRNRFNEHELWFVAHALFPKAAADAPRFWSPRPLSTIRGAESFLVPDFTDHQEAGAGPRWQGFLLKPQTVSGRDFDALGRRGFDWLEGMLRAGWVTSRTRTADGGLLWAAILKGKDVIAKLLGSVQSNFVVPVFTDGPAPSGQAGIERLSQDAFQRDLRLFYGIDALVQWPVEFPASTAGIANFYGKTVATVTAADVSGQPKYSDFILNAKEDRGVGGQPGAVTVTYDLPPGYERHWRQWTTNSLTANITHLQLPLPGQGNESLFNRGQWLELLPGDILGGMHYEPNMAVPVADRRFPAEPSLSEVTTLQHAEEANGISAVPPERLSQWGWKIVLEAEDNPNDTIYLEVAYNGSEAEIREAEDAADPVDWATQSLLHDLVILDTLAAFPSAWWGTPPGVATLAVIPMLLEFLYAHLAANSREFSDPSDERPDIFTIKLTPTVTPGAGQRVTQVTPSKETSEKTGLAHLTLEAAPSEALHLFGARGAQNFQPQLRLKRNDDLVEKRVVNSLLVYSCGPVVHPEVVRVTNRWHVVIPPIPAGRTLREALELTLSGIFGNEANLEAFMLRLDAKHVFTVGDRELVNPFRLYPSDLKLGAISQVAATVADEYRSWLQKQGGSAVELLRHMDAPKFRLGLQVAKSTTFTRMILEIEGLDFALTDSSFS